MDRDDLTRIDTKLDDLKDCFHDLDKKADITLDRLERHLHEDSQNLENITKSLESVNERLDVYNAELRIHIQGVQELRQANILLREYIDTENRKMSEDIKIAATPIKWLRDLKSGAVWISAVVAAGAAIGMALKWLAKLI